MILRNQYENNCTIDLENVEYFVLYIEHHNKISCIATSIVTGWFYIAMLVTTQMLESKEAAILKLES